MIIQQTLMKCNTDNADRLVLWPDLEMKLLKLGQRLVDGKVWFSKHVLEYGALPFKFTIQQILHVELTEVNLPNSWIFRRILCIPGLIVFSYNMASHSNIVAFLLLLLMSYALAFGNMRSHTPGSKKSKPRREDLPFIRCQACEALASQAWTVFSEMKAKETPGLQLKEAEVVDAIEKMGTSWRPEGHWLLKYHPVEEKGKLVLKDMGIAGNCGRDCRTVETAIQDLLDSHDTDMAEVLFSGKNKDMPEFSTWMCNEMSPVCKKTIPPLPTDRRPPGEFKPQTEAQARRDRVLGTFTDNGLDGEMFNRAEIMQQLGLEYELDDDEDDALLKRKMEEAMERGNEL